ncbi:MAG TPA: Asp-tRNA(Asn)/Glu-tRNA(Gln) amidotransferase subunit GatB [Gemmatimonadaceae bacterium]|nr:Asp-tRNA(Asn)/Glu-tRNA(Gln) amidotransferase subunit GatB [Gemmatimonadaceae bacterium]
MTVPAPAVSEKYEMVVGLEVHVQLRTRTKLFCNCSTQFGEPPNRNTCPVCLALPGALPVLNQTAVELATRAALALGADVHEESIFARKNYFYPDLPKGYQISQFDKPLATNGKLVIGERGDGTPIQIGITRVHMEEDAGKSVHDRFSSVSAIDLNRAGVPLIEIVSEPDIRSSAEAGSYCRLLKQLLEYVDVSDLNMEEGSLRVDANISIRPRGKTKLGTKTEVKNMNSFSGVERAIDAEFARQVSIVESGGSVEQQTLLWDADRGSVRPARSKEGSHDYRYFPDPDLPPLRLTNDWIAQARERLPELPEAKRRRFAEEHKLPAYDVDVLTASSRIADYFDTVARAHGDSKVAANWVMGEVLAVLKSAALPIDRFPVRPADLATLLDMIRTGAVSNSAAKRIFALMVQTGDLPQQIAEREGLAQVGDEMQIAAWVDDVLASQAAEWDRYRAGEKKLLGVFVGAVMKKSGGRADPKKVNQLLAARANG